MNTKKVTVMTVLLAFLLFFSNVSVCAQKMYWADPGSDKIQRANLDGSNVEDLVITGLSNPHEIALDIVGGKIYWTDWGTDKIQRANLDGSNVEDLITGLAGPAAISLDINGGKMYWTDFVIDKIHRADLDGSNIEDLVTSGLSTPTGIVLDATDGKMYWTDYDTDKIQRANLDGSNIEDLVTTGLSFPAGIVLDVVGGKIYWTDWGTNKIQRANLDGSNVEDLITTGLTSPRGISLDIAGGKMYWTDNILGKIQRANLDGSDVEDLITTDLTNPIAISLDLQESVGSVFTYQGQLQKDGTLLNELCDLRFSLWTESAGGLRVGPEHVLTDVTPVDGIFTVPLDFGENAFFGKQRWMEIAVKCIDDPNYVTLSPRQLLTATPYAQHALTAERVSWNNIFDIPDGINDDVDWSQLTGVPAGFADGVDNGVENWNQLSGIPSGFADGVDDGIESWGQLTGIPAGFADGIDNTGSDGSDHAHSSLNAADGNPMDAVFVDDDGRVGVGTTAPAANLHIHGDDTLGAVLVTPNTANSKSQVFLAEQSSTSFGMIMRYDGAVNQLHFIAQQSGTETSPLVSINRSSAGYVGIGTDSPSEKLHVNGNVLANNVSVPSDIRFKRNVAELSQPLEKVSQLRGVYFDWKQQAYPERNFSGERQVGFIAQELKSVYPQAVLQSDDGTYSVDYGRLTPLLLEAIKAQQEAIERQEKEIVDLEQRLKALELQRETDPKHYKGDDE